MGRPRKPIKRNLKRINVRRSNKGVINRARRRAMTKLNNRDEDFTQNYMNGEYDESKWNTNCCQGFVCPKGFICARNCKCLINNGDASPGRK
jgi:hypothetical protein